MTKVKYILKAIKESRLGCVIGSFLKHDCDNYKRIISHNFRVVDNYLVEDIKIEYKCLKCDKRWSA